MAIAKQTTHEASELGHEATMDTYDIREAWAKLRMSHAKACMGFIRAHAEAARQHFEKQLSDQCVSNLVTADLHAFFLRRIPNFV